MPLFTVFQPCLSHFELLQDTIYNIRYMNITFTIKSLPFARVLVPMYSAPQTKYQRTPKLKSLMRPENQELHVGNDTHMLFSVPSDDPMLSLRGPTSFFFSIALVAPVIYALLALSLHFQAASLPSHCKV